MPWKSLYSQFYKCSTCLCVCFDVHSKFSLKVLDIVHLASFCVSCACPNFSTGRTEQYQMLTSLVPLSQPDRFPLALGACIISDLVMAAQTRALVSGQWLADAVRNNLVGPKLRVLDTSWYLPKTKRNPRAEFAEKHIPGSSFFDIDECSDKTSAFDHMLPTGSHFSRYVGGWASVATRTLLCTTPATWARIAPPGCGGCSGCSVTVWCRCWTEA